ncbi:MAG: hypothetical protein HY814_06550 [Candidatus Riflebacteria bacterium]|nr:hypothetical protein [Candidatus Riflebacteria bacterium]
MFRSRAGVSLVEALLALAVLGVALGAVLGTFTSGTLATQQVVQTTRALQMAARQLELVRLSPFETVAAFPASRPLDSSAVPGPFEGVVEREDLSSGELVLVRVRIRWQVNEKLTEKVELATFFLNPRAR